MNTVKFPSVNYLQRRTRCKNAVKKTFRLVRLIPVRINNIPTPIRNVITFPNSKYPANAEKKISVITKGEIRFTPFAAISFCHKTLANERAKT